MDLWSCKTQRGNRRWSVWPKGHRDRRGARSNAVWPRLAEGTADVLPGSHRHRNRGQRGLFALGVHGMGLGTREDETMRDIPLNRIAGVPDSRDANDGIAHYEVESQGHFYIVRFNAATIAKANEILHSLITLASMGSDLREIQWEAGE
jgi:hypothetical protein